MIDRNTLTALLLITLVLILTPYYMDLVSPTQQTDYDLVEQELETEIGASSYVDTTIEDRTVVNPGLESQLKVEEKTITIESDLYIAKISSICGGSILSYKIKDHLTTDSNYVNLITKDNANNLLLSFKNLDGDDVFIKDGWVQQGLIDSLYIFDETHTLSYTNTLRGKNITKTLTFYPDAFLIEIDIDLTSISNNVFANTCSFGWVGGIPMSLIHISEPTRPERIG